VQNYLSYISLVGYTKITAVRAKADIVKLQESSDVKALEVRKAKKLEQRWVGNQMIFGLT